VGIVFLFDMSVVLSMVGAGAGELDWDAAVSKVIVEGFIDKFTAVVRVKAEDGKRQGPLDVFGLMQDGFTGFAPNGALFGPTGGDVVEVNGEDVLTGLRFAAMVDGIGFDKARAKFIPLVSLDGDLFAKKRSRLGGREAAFFEFWTDGFEQAVDGRGRDVC